MKQIGDKDRLGNPAIIEYYTKTKKNRLRGKELRSIISGFNAHIISEVLEGHKVALPEKLGFLLIKGKKPNIRVNDEGEIRGVAVNWKATNDLWKEHPELKERKEFVYHFNEETDGIRYKFHWTKTGIAIKHRDFYSLRMARGTKRKLPVMLRKGKEYICET